MWMEPEAARCAKVTDSNLQGLCRGDEWEERGDNDPSFSSWVDGRAIHWDGDTEGVLLHPSCESMSSILWTWRSGWMSISAPLLPTNLNYCLWKIQFHRSLFTEGIRRESSLQRERNRCLLRRSGGKFWKEKFWTQNFSIEAQALNGVLGEEECETVIYNKKYIFGLRPHSWHRAPKILIIF